MRTFANAVAMLALVAILAPAPASAQNSNTKGTSVFDLRPGLTKAQFEQFTGELGSVLRFRQLGDATTVAKGDVEISAQFANTPFNDSKIAWSPAGNGVGRSLSYPQVVARFGLGDRVDLGAWGGFDPRLNYGLGGVDTKIALLRQGPGMPVSVSIRPSITSLIGPSEVWVGTASIDVSVSRAFGPWSPYGGLAASTSAGIERSVVVNLDAVTVNRSLAYAGLAYRWRSLTMAAEMEKGDRFNYAFRVGTRF